MRDVDSDLVALPVATRGEVESRCIAPEDRVDEGIGIGGGLASDAVDPDTFGRSIAPDGKRPDVGQVIESRDVRAIRVGAAVEEDVAAAITVIDLVVADT